MIDLSFSSVSLSISNSGSYRISVPPGIYFLECWGSKGSNSAIYFGLISKGGSGGYSSGVYVVLENIFIYSYVGGIGTSSTSTSGLGGFNGGGECGQYSGGGGGATDFRTDVSLESRIIVAGGGGGAIGGDPQLAGGCGGGISGFSGEQYNINLISCYGTQISCEGGSDANHIPGLFGNGGGQTSLYYSGGGGGYYGGGAIYMSGGGGGSGFIGGVTNNSSFKNITLGCESSFLSPSGVEVQGNDGPGFARITRIDLSMEYSTRNQNNPNIYDMFSKIPRYDLLF